jgi:SRSO17 transposase
LPGERKSVEPMAARLAPDNVRRMHQSLHHLVADAPWNDDEMLAQVRRHVNSQNKRECVLRRADWPRNVAHYLRMNTHAAHR